jgi:hypothetical protein
MAPSLEIDVAYLAGVFDSCGDITIEGIEIDDPEYPQYPRVCVSFYIKNEALLKKIRQFLYLRFSSGSQYYHPRDGELLLARLQLIDPTIIDGLLGLLLSFPALQKKNMVLAGLLARDFLCSEKHKSCTKDFRAIVDGLYQMCLENRSIPLWTVTGWPKSIGK